MAQNDKLDVIINRIQNNLNLCFHLTLCQSPEVVLNNRSPLDPLKRYIYIDLQKIRELHKIAGERSLKSENKSRASKEWKIGDKVLVRKPLVDKESSLYSSSFTVEGVKRNKLVLENDRVVIEQTTS